jgi:DNA-binding CsgD family transcriptional regulator
MPVQERLPSSLAALTDKEREVLRLLAAGHTVKSIAASLERSEASINERLRDARRKTGVGSSRELARLLDAQKIWDKNTDLPRQHTSTESRGQPHDTGRPWSKGTIVMLVGIPLAAAGLLITAINSIQSNTPPQIATPPAAQAAAPRGTPLAGKWSLDLARIPAEERPRQVTIVFRVSKDRKWMTLVEIVAPDGSTRRAGSTAALDGIAVPVTGNMDFIDSVSLRQPAPNTLVMTLNKNGAPVSTRVYTVSKDRKSMTETIVWSNNGIPKMETTYFDRIA